jgi:hypothetical protein
MRSPARTPMTKSPCCTALYDFEPENPGELGFKVSILVFIFEEFLLTFRLDIQVRKLPVQRCVGTKNNSILLK